MDEKLLEAGDHGGATFYELQNFAASIRESKNPEVSAFDGVQAVLMGLAAQKSTFSQFLFNLITKSIHFISF